jgi:WD40 repeat protein
VDREVAVARVFVSHAGEDVALADEVHRWLVADGHEVFLDQDLRDGLVVGEEWEQRLYERLRWADAVVSLLTSAYLASVWCTAELTIAQTRGSRLLPVRAEPGVHHPLLTALQRADATIDMHVARVQLAEALRRVDAAGGAGLPDDRSPFPGLRPFDTDLHRVFFGRTREIEQLATLLRSPGERAERAVLLVVGPSGCGKSSLVRAGLVPVMAGEPGWQTVPVILPGTQPVAALTRELAAVAQQCGLGWSTAEIRRRLDDGGLAELGNDLLLAGLGPRRTHLLIVVDQFEELLTQAMPAERARFADLLGPALAGPVQVVGTLRPEFLDQLLADPDLAVLPTRVHTVRPLRREALSAVVEGPARLAGIDVDEELVARLVADTDSGEALPLLAYTLAQLANGVGRGGRLLASRYEQLGGVQGALARQADAALIDATAKGGRNRDQVVRELLRLVTVDEQGRPTRWRVRRAELPAPVAAELDAFVARRLVTTDIENGQVVVGVAHEAFLDAWPPLAEAITAASTALRARRQIEQAAANWAEHEQPSDRLWERGQLAAALADTGARLQTSNESPPGAQDEGAPVATRRTLLLWRRRPHLGHRVVVTDRVELSGQARDFLLASIRRDRRRRGRSTAILSTLLILAVLAAGTALIMQNVAGGQRRAAEERQRLATSRLLLARAEATLASDPRTALRLGEAAYRIHPEQEIQASLAHLLINTRFSAVLDGNTGGLDSVAFAADGRTLATASRDDGVLLWDVAGPGRPRRLGDPLTEESVDSMAFAPDGRTLATTRGLTVLLWDIADPGRPHRLGETQLISNINPGRPGDVLSVLSVVSMAFAPDGRTLATASGEGTVQLWDVVDPARPRPLGEPQAGHTDYVYSVAFAPDGRTLATASQDRTVLLWDVADPARPRRLGDPMTGQWFTDVAFAPDGHTLATAGSDVLLWDVTDPARPRRRGDPLTGHTNTVSSVAFAPDGRTLATASYDRTVLLWEVTDPNRPRRLGGPLIGHTGDVNAVAFAPDGRTLATASADRTVLLWEVTDPNRPRPLGDPLTGHTHGVYSVAFAPDGHTLATAGGDNTVLLWGITDPARPRRLGDPMTVHGFTDVAFAPSGHTLATASDEGTVQLWDVADPARPRPLGEPLTGLRPVAFAPDGRTLVTATTEDLTVLLWDVADPARPHRLGEPLTGHNTRVDGIAFAPDGHTLTTAGGDGNVQLWDVADPARARRLGALTGPTDTVSSVAFAPDGRTLATGGDRTVLLWDVTDPARPRRLGDPLTGHHARVGTVAFAADGRTLATAGQDGNVQLWDVADPARSRPLGDLGEPLTGQTAGAFAPDGHILATTASNSLVQVWDLSGLNALRADPLGRACSRTGRGLTPEEWGRFVPDLDFADSCTR